MGLNIDKMTKNENINIIIINIGDELLGGEIINSDFKIVASAVTCYGGSVVKQISLPDNKDVIKKSFENAFSACDAVITTGGLGPTADDLTKKIAAEIFGKKLVSKSRLYNVLKERYKFSVPAVTEDSMREQSLVPEGAKIIANKIGSAPGFYLAEGKRKLLMFPGPPAELIPMLDDGLKSLGLSGGGKGAKTVKYFSITGMSESVVDSTLRKIIGKSSGISYGLRAHPGEIIIRIKREIAAGSKFVDLIMRIREEFGNNIFSEDEESVEETVGKLLKGKKKTVAVAESCTGGQLGKMITDIPGSSEYFLGGYVTYYDNLKILDLGVSQDTLVEHGAVSSQCALQMARGCRRRSTSDIAIGITGIAGPGGGSEEKPVGLVYVALDDGFISRTEEFKFNGTSREQIRERACRAALDLLRRYLLIE